MRNRIAIRWARNPLLAAVLLVAFLARALVPTGFMPGPGGFVLCTGHGPMIVSMPSDMPGMDMGSMDMSGMDMSQHAGTPGQGGHAPDHESMGVCPFAAAAASMVVLDVPGLSRHTPFISTDVALPLQPFIPRGTIVPTRLPRGPPTFA